MDVGTSSSITKYVVFTDCSTENPHIRTLNYRRYKKKIDTCSNREVLCSIPAGINCPKCWLKPRDGRLYPDIADKLSRLVGKPTMWFPNRSDTNRPVKAQKRARSLKFRIYEGGSKSSRKSAAKFVIVFGNLRSLCIL